MLLGPEYRPGVVNSAIERAKAIPRTKALEKVPPKITDRVVFALDFNPQLPSVSGIVKSAWRVMSKDPKMKAVFPKPPMVAWRRPKSLKDKLVKTKVPEQQNRPQRKSHGMRKCNKNGCLKIQEKQSKLIPFATVKASELSIIFNVKNVLKNTLVKLGVVYQNDLKNTEDM